MADTRPTWPHSEMSEAEFRAVHNIGMVVSVVAKREMTGEDTAREWLVVVNSAGRSARLPHGWQHVLTFVGYASIPGLFKYTPLGERMRTTLREIDQWEKTNAKERQEYERLKEKFGA